MTIFKTIRKYFVLFLKKYLRIIPSYCINNDMKCRYFQYWLKPTKERCETLESYGSATRCVWNYCLEPNQAVSNIQCEEINIISRTRMDRIQIQAREDTSGGDVAYATSSHVSMNREKFLSTGKEAAFLWVRGSPHFQGDD